MPTSKTTVYTVPVGRSAILQNITCVNTGVTSVTVNITADFGSGSRNITPKNLTLPPGAKHEDAIGITLEAGDLLEVVAGASGQVDYILSGVEAA